MKLKFIAPEHEESTPLESQHFSIRDKDMHIIIDLLRSKLYKDPMTAMCREVMANARDSHREAGTPDLPIEVTLPTAFNRQIQIRDFGVGISPRRMGEIFLNYGASTKRRDNTQTGAFGLGSKSPYSVSDQYTVISIYNGVKRQYTAFIDETKMGRMDLVHEEETTEHNGTTVIVPIKPGQEDYCARAVIKITKYWPVRPVLVNKPESINYPVEKEPLIVADDGSWSITSLVDVAYGETDKCMAIVDGMPYHVKAEDLHVNWDDSTIWIRSLLSKHLLMHFKTGTISLVPSRDNILFDEPTVKNILNRLNKIKKAVFEHAVTKAENAETLLEAEVFWEEFQSLLPSIAKEHKPVWNGITLSGTTISAKDTDKKGISIRAFSLHSRKRRTSTRTPEEIKVVSTETNRIQLSRNMALYWNDTDKVRGFSSRMALLLGPDENGEKSNLNIVYLVSFDNDDSKEHWLEERHLNDMGIKPASALPETMRAARGSRAGTYARKETIDCWKFNKDYVGDLKDHERGWEPTTVEKFGRSSGVYVTSVNKNQQEYECGKLKYLGFRRILELTNLCGLGGSSPIHLVPRRLVGMLGPGWKRLDDVAVPKILELFASVTPEKVDEIERAKEVSASNKLYRHIHDVVTDEIGKGIDANSSIAKYIADSQAISAEVKRVNEITELQSGFSYLRPDSNASARVYSTPQVEISFNQALKDYPILFKVREYLSVEVVTTYIKAMDIYNKQKNIVDVTLPDMVGDSVDEEEDYVDEQERYCVAV